MEEQQLIIIKQLPEIEANLKAVSEEIQLKVNNAKQLVCNDETKQIIKKVRAELNKEFLDFEWQRKNVKERILEPYNSFEKIYKEYISDKYKEADTELKNKIDQVENEIKKQKEDDLRAYFEEYKKYKNIEFIDFERANIKIGLSDSKTALHKQAKDFIDKIYSDINLIDTQDHKEEIMVEYKQTLNVGNAITIVKTRYEEIEKEKKRKLEEEKKKAEIRLKQQEENTKIALENLRPQNEILNIPKVEEKEEILTLKFTVRATKSKLKALKQYLIDGGYDYE